jgi:hypothetical protein
MKTLLRTITMNDLAAIYQRGQELSPASYLNDRKCIQRARRNAKKTGIWDDITAGLDPTKDIPGFRRSDFRNYQRNGNRTIHQNKEGERRRELSLAFTALWLNHPSAHLDYLQDLLWAYCDDFTWVMAAHEGRSIDLGSSMLAASLSEILHVLGDKLEDEVRERVSSEIEKRIFQNFWNYRNVDFWKTIRMNWNHVCNGEIIRTALYEIEEPSILAQMTHGAIQNMTYAIDGFTDDGGCEEGPAYWAYGFGHYLFTAHALYLKTGGELNIMQGEKIERICRYPLAAHIEGSFRSTFADSSHGYIPYRHARIINEFYDIPELYELCSTRPDRSLKIVENHELALYDGRKASGKPDNRDYLLPDLGQVKLRGEPGPKQMTVLALAGNNGVPHNHNDIGSFIVYRHGKLHLVDPGGPVYTKKTFSSRRYEILHCNSLGHSVPIINGRQQEAGAEFFGTLKVENLNGEGTKTAAIDMSHAYPKGTVKSLLRTVELDSSSNRLTLEDAYAFSRKPRSIEEAFITFENARIIAKGREVRLGTKANGLTVRAKAEGTFSVHRMEEESKEGRGGEVVTRIVFTPSKLDKEMVLAFEVG